MLIVVVESVDMWINKIRISQVPYPYGGGLLLPLHLADSTCQAIDTLSTGGKCIKRAKSTVYMTWKWQDYISGDSFYTPHIWGV